MIYDVMASNLSALHSMVRHKLTLSPICLVWVEEGLDCWDTFNLLAGDLISTQWEIPSSVLLSQLKVKTVLETKSTHLPIPWVVELIWSKWQLLMTT